MESKQSQVIAEIINFLAENSKFYDCLAFLHGKGFDAQVISIALNQIMINAKHTDRFSVSDCEA